MEGFYERADKQIDYHLTNGTPSYPSVEDTVDKVKRYRQITEILRCKGPQTAKQISVEMFRRGYTPTTERNFSAPRLTELMQKGTVVVVGTTKCEYTGKTVRQFCLVED